MLCISGATLGLLHLNSRSVLEMLAEIRRSFTTLTVVSGRREPSKRRT